MGSIGGSDCRPSSAPELARVVVVLVDVLVVDDMVAVNEGRSRTWTWSRLVGRRWSMAAGR